MKAKIVSCVLIASLVFALSGCQSIPEEHKGAAVGAGVGAATGAAAGAVLGKSTTAAVLGGLAGALIGGVVGHYAYDQQKNRDETAKTYDYTPSKGTVLTIEESSTVPQTVAPGGLVDLKMTYAVLNPTPGMNTKITEIREIRYNTELVGKPEVIVDRVDGTYTSTVPLRLPAAAKKGEYKVTTTVQSETAKDTREITFTVQ